MKVLMSKNTSFLVVSLEYFMIDSQTEVSSWEANNKPKGFLFPHAVWLCVNVLNMMLLFILRRDST